MTWVEGFKILWVGRTEYHRSGVRYNMDGGFNISFIVGSMYHGKRVKIPWVRGFINPE